MCVCGAGCAGHTHTRDRPSPAPALACQCYIERDRSGLSNKIYPCFTLYLKASEWGGEWGTVSGG